MNIRKLIGARSLSLAIVVSILHAAPAYGQGGYDTPKKVDTFDAGPERVRTTRRTQATPAPRRQAQPRPAPAQRGPVVRLTRGRVVEVLSSSRSARPELAFYLPPEATSVVQLVVERKGSQNNYFLKAIGRGKTVGGAVERAWLDREGFRPRNIADEARIQAALRSRPLHIEVQ